MEVLNIWKIRARKELGSKCAIPMLLMDAVAVFVTFESGCDDSITATELPVTLDGIFLCKSAFRLANDSTKPLWLAKNRNAQAL